MADDPFEVFRASKRQTLEKKDPTILVREQAEENHLLFQLASDTRRQLKLPSLARVSVAVTFIKQHLARNASEHICLGEKCSWRSLPRNKEFTDPETGATMKATGMIFLCPYSANVHRCDGAECVPFEKSFEGTFVCSVSGRSTGGMVAATGVVADRNTIKQSGWFLSGAPQQQARKRKGPMSGQITSSARRLQLPRAVSNLANQILGVNQNDEQDEEDDPVPRATTTAGTPRKFADGSVADRLAKSIAAGQLRMSISATNYGQRLFLFACLSLSTDNFESAKNWCKLLLFSKQVTDLHNAKNAATYEAADSASRRLGGASTRLDPVSFAMFVFITFYNEHRPLLDRAVWMALADPGCIRSAVEYFSWALLFVWKLVEATPSCCEEGKYEGGPSPKRKRVHSHLNKYAIPIIFLLIKGYRIPVMYDEQSRLLLNDVEANALRATLAPGQAEQRIKSTTVVFLRKHRFLALSLPDEQQVRQLDFSNVLCKTTTAERTPGSVQHAKTAKSFDPKLVTRMGWLTEAFRSLTNVRPAVTIEALQEYRLENYLPYSDLNPDTARFVEMS